MLERLPKISVIHTVRQSVENNVYSLHTRTHSQSIGPDRSTAQLTELSHKPATQHSINIRIRQIERMEI